MMNSHMETMFGNALYLLLFMLLFSPVAISELCHPHDKKVLLQIKEDLNNPYLLPSWDPETDCCEWGYDVGCHPETNRVYYLAIYPISAYVRDNFSGQIPPSVGDLPYLESLEFNWLPKLSGLIQPTIAKLTKLKYLLITRTGISGPIPDFLAQLKNLEFLTLSANNLSGPIPASLSQLPNLVTLNLERNRLTGLIPSLFGSFTKLGRELDLSHNQLSGNIPASLGRLDPERMDLSMNKLEGDASVLFGHNKRTEELDISGNVFLFDLSKVKFPKKSLTWLDLSHNKIYGSIPVGLTPVENLRKFNVSYNQLCGKIPQGGELRRFDKYSYLHNKCLCDPPLPSCKYVDAI